MSNSMANNCAVGCKGYWLTMTGDIVKDDVTEKPANRQAAAATPPCLLLVNVGKVDPVHHHSP